MGKRSLALWLVLSAIALAGSDARGDFSGPALKPGWPVRTGRWIKHSAVLLVDLEDDGKKEIVVGSTNGSLYCLNSDGSTRWVYPAGIWIDGGAAAADLDGDGFQEIAFGVGSFANHTPGKLVVLEHTGTLKWERLTIDVDFTGQRESIVSTPAILDVNCDGTLDIIIGAVDHRIYAFTANGDILYQEDNDGDGRFNEDPAGDWTPWGGDGASGYAGVDDDGDGLVDEGHPNDDDEDSLEPGETVVLMTKVDEDPFEWPHNNQDSVASSAAIGDIDGDGTVEIVIGGDSSDSDEPGNQAPRGGLLRVLDWKGNLRAPFDPMWFEQVIWSSPALYDLDGDGKMEIIFGSGHERRDPTGQEIYGNWVQVLRHDGAPYPGWPRPTAREVFASPAIADFDGDGQPEIACAEVSFEGKGGKIYVWKHTGELLPGWPVQPMGEEGPVDILASPVFADIDEDGKQELVMGVTWYVMGFNDDGTIVPGMGRYMGVDPAPVTWTGYTVFSTPAIDDIDGDGKLELVAASAEMGNIEDGAVFVYELGSNHPGALAWPQFRLNAQRTGWVEPDFTVLCANVFAASGTEGGPFEPASMTYWLRNNGNNTVSWRVSKEASWLDLSASSGALVPGASSTVESSINNSATSLPAGDYSDVIRFADAGNSRVIANRDARLQVWAPLADVRLYNISTRGFVGLGGEVMIAGFIIEGPDPKEVVVTAWGASLDDLGVPNTLYDPTLTLYSDQQVEIGGNDNWWEGPDRDQIVEFGLQPRHNNDAAALLTLEPGAYTAILSGVGGRTGNALVAVWDPEASQSLLSNISTRGVVGSGDAVMIAGFIIEGTEAQKVAVTAWGPSLADYGTPNVLSDPTLAVFSGQTQIAESDNWQDSQYEDALIEANLAPSDPLEAAVVLTLEPGPYTAILSGVDGETGNGLVAVWRLD